MDIYTKDAINNKLTKKQDTLVSGTNIKTINGNSLLGSGNVAISGGGGSGASVSSTEFSGSNTQLNGLTINGTNYKLLDVKVNNGTNLIIGGNRSLASGASGVVAIGACSSSTASGNISTAIGYGSSASSMFSTALGYASSANGYASTAIGSVSKASSDNSTAIGNDTNASGNYSIAIGSFSTASGNYSNALGYYSRASSDNSTAIGYNSTVYVPSWVNFDGTSDSLVRTVALKSTDNIFFRNENVDTSKTTQASYTDGKTLTQVLNTKQDTLVSGTNIKTINGNSLLGSGDVSISGSGGSGSGSDKLVRISISNIKEETTGGNYNGLVFVGYYNLINSELEKLDLDLETLSANWKALMAGEKGTSIWGSLCDCLSRGWCFSCFYFAIGGDELEPIVSPIMSYNYLGYIILNGTTPEGHIVFNSETALKGAFADSTMILDD